MSQLTDNLNTILDIKNNIATAITNKGVDMFEKSFIDYPSAIDQINTTAVVGKLTTFYNGTYLASSIGWDGYNEVEVNVSPMTSYLQGEMDFVLVDTDTASFVASSIMAGNQEVQQVHLQNCLIVFTMAFDNCPMLSIVDLPSCSKVYNFAFASCNSLSYVSIPLCNEIYDNAFDKCIGLTSIEAPVCTFISNRAFQDCASLSFISFPMVSKINGDAFKGCTGLSDITLPEIINIGPRAFQNCTGLMAVHLPGLSFCSLYNSTVFENTHPDLSIYVNNQLYDQYITDSKWSWYSSRIVSV